MILVNSFIRHTSHVICLVDHDQMRMRYVAIIFIHESRTEVFWNGMLNDFMMLLFTLVSIIYFDYFWESLCIFVEVLYSYLFFTKKTEMDDKNLYCCLSRLSFTPSFMFVALNCWVHLYIVLPNILLTKLRYSYT